VSRRSDNLAGDMGNVDAAVSGSRLAGYAAQQLRLLRRVWVTVFTVACMSLGMLLWPLAVGAKGHAHRQVAEDDQCLCLV
jgi:hypothetical protein